jgi:hypothetical protein
MRETAAHPAQRIPATALARGHATLKRDWERPARRSARRTLRREMLHREHGDTESDTGQNESETGQNESGTPEMPGDFARVAWKSQPRRSAAATRSPDWLMRSPDWLMRSPNAWMQIRHAWLQILRAWMQIRRAGFQVGGPGRRFRRPCNHAREQVSVNNSNNRSCRNTTRWRRKSSWSRAGSVSAGKYTRPSGGGEAMHLPRAARGSRSCPGGPPRSAALCSHTRGICSGRQGLISASVGTSSHSIGTGSHRPGTHSG